MSPLLTVAIPTYNRPDDLDNLLASIAREIKTVPPGSVEVLISDNASTDHTPSVVEKHAKNCPEMRPVRNSTNIGMQANFAQCMDLCRGEFLYMIGDDEVILEGGLNIILEALRATQASIFVFNYTQEQFPDMLKFLLRVAGRPIDTNVSLVRDFVFRHGWFWTLANLGMVVVKAAPLKAAANLRAPHMGHTFMQAALYLEVFYNDPMIFIDRPIFHTFIRSQTVNKERWEHDGNIAGWPLIFNSLEHLIAKGILPPLLPITFFNHCSCEWQPTWAWLMDRILGRICAGNMSVTPEEWDNARRWVRKLDDEKRRDRILMAMDSLQAAYIITKTSYENFSRTANLLLFTLKGL